MWSGSSEFCFMQRHPFARQKSVCAKARIFSLFSSYSPSSRCQTKIIDFKHFFFIINALKKKNTVWHMGFGFRQNEQTFYPSAIFTSFPTFIDFLTPTATRDTSRLCPLVLAFSVRLSRIPSVMSVCEPQAKILVSCPAAFHECTSAFEQCADGDD